LPRLALEQHMAAYKAECDAQLEVQVASRVERMREVELAAARQEAAARWVICEPVLLKEVFGLVHGVAH
jgi:hypothetical protein